MKIERESHMVKLGAKRAIVWFLSNSGRSIPCAGLRDWLVHRICRRLLDERVVSRGFTPRRLRGLSGRVLCNPYVYTHRVAYWFGTLYERPLEMYLRRNLRPGDTVIDVGSNLGHVTVLSACLVGQTGRVYAFDANDSVADLLSRHCASEGLSWVTVHPVGLGEEESQLVLHCESSTTGTATLRATAVQADCTSRTARICAGDAMLAGLEFPGRTFLKVDVEGFEREVLRGMSTTLRERVDQAVLEVSPEWIGMHGTQELFRLMGAAGFTPFDLGSNGQRGPEVRPGDITEQRNVLFVKR